MTKRRTLTIPALAAAAALLALGIASAQVGPAAPAAAAPAASASAHAAHAASAPRPAKAAVVRPGPLWRELPAGQQQALAPLAGQWDTLNEAQKRKWIAMSSNYPKMSGDEQAKLQSRMAEWVALSPQQRSIARLNYGATQKLSPDDKKAKWDAYLALPPEEKKKLAAKATSPKPPTTAAAVKPVPREKLAVLPKARHGESKPPRIAAAPNAVNAAPGMVPQTAAPPAPRAEPVPPQAGTPD